MEAGILTRVSTLQKMFLNGDYMHLFKNSVLSMFSLLGIMRIDQDCLFQ